MNTKLTIKNFRVFDENGVSIDIKPLTILTGCNSSGKSSIVKAAFLLNSFIKQISKANEEIGNKIKLSNYKLDFTRYPNNLLGRFDKVIPKGSSSQKVTLGYSIHSYLLSKDVDVLLVFAADENDDLNNAYLESISMSIEGGVFYSSDKEKGSAYNLNLIKNYLPSFVKAKIVIDDVCDLFSLPIGEEFGISEEYFENEKNNLVPQLQEIGRDRIMDIAKYIRFTNDSIHLKYKKEQRELLKWTEDNNSFFNIPVLDYLHSISKEEIWTVVEEKMVSDDGMNTYLANHSVVLSASKKVVDDFMASPFDTFDAYFKDFEHRFLEHAVAVGKDYPCLAKTTISQTFLTNHPEGFWRSSEAIYIGDENEPSFKPAKTPEQKMKEWNEMPLTFDALYNVIMLWNEKYTTENSEYYYTGGCKKDSLPDETFETPGSFHHDAFEMLTTFAEHISYETILNSGFENMSYVSSARATVKKLYAMEEKSDFTELLQRYFDAKHNYVDRDYSLRSKYKVNEFINHWIKQFKLGESLSFELDEDGLGVKILLHKTNDDKGHLLSDEGYGITQLISIMLQIETAIISAKNEKANDNYGLTAIDKYDTDVFHFEECTIAIEEPEIHLHPSYQSKLAEMFVEAYSKYNIHFIIETHSEYLIRKLQTLAAKKIINSNDISIQYVYSPNIEERPLYTPQITSIKVKSDGRLTDSFGPGFFDEADNAAMELLTLKEQNL